MARTTTGVALLKKYAGDPQSIQRMQAVIETLAGKKSVVDACQELDICEALFRRFRDVALQAAISALDPKQVGRKPREPEPGQEKIAELEKEQERLQMELMGAQVRLELKEAGCAKNPAEDVKKNSWPKRGRE